MKKFYLLIQTLFVLLSGSLVYSQTYFKPVGDLTSAMNINIVEARVNGINLVAGDEIGIFDGNLCVGVVKLTKSIVAFPADIAAVAAGADDTDTPVKDGFKAGNEIKFRIYDVSEEEEIVVTGAIFINPSNGLEIANPGFDVGSTAFVKINVTHDYTPKAKAGPDFEINENTPGNLDGSASYELNGSIEFYEWEDIDNIGLSGAGTVSPGFTAPEVTVNTNFRFKLVVTDNTGKVSKPDTVVVTVKQVNKPPVAKAGTDFEIPEGEAGELDGSGSNDPDGLALTYSWVIEPADFALTSPTSAKTSFTAPLVTNDKEYLAILTVTNTVPLSKKDTVKIKVINFNIKPIANAGADQEVNEGATVTLNGSASSDPDNAPNLVLTYLWTAPDGIILNNANTATPDFVAPFFLKDSVLRFTLVVNDGGANSNPDEVLIKVKHKNLKPVANAGTGFSADENTVVELNGSASYDLDGTLTFKWTATGITITGSTLVNPTFVAPEVQADSIITFTLTVTDNNLETDIATVNVTIKHVNKKPVANAGPDQEVDEDITVTLDGSKSFDPDMYDNITFQWFAPAGISLSGQNSHNPTFISPVITDEYIDYIFKLVVSDGKVFSDTDFVKVRVIHLNLPPVADAGADFSIDENVNGNLDGSNSSDFEGKPLTYLWTAPAGFVISDPTLARPSFDPPQVEKDEVFEVTLVVNDGVRSSLPATVKVTVRQVNKPPVANAGPDRSLPENVTVQLNGTASYDTDALDVITYLWTSLDGIVLDDVTSPTPTFTTPWLLANKVYRFSLTVNDGKVDSEPDEVAITVVHANLRPTANAGDDKTMDENTKLKLSGEASSDPEMATLTYFWTVPVGLTIDDPTSATPEITAAEVHQDTEYEVMLTVNDGATENNTHTDVVKITVKHINKPPVANAGTNKTVNENELVQLDGTASSDPDALDVITYLWTAPAGIVLDDVTSATPTFISPLLLADKVLKFTLTVNDGIISSLPSEVEVLVKHANLKPTANAGGNQTMNENSSLQLDASGSSDPEGVALSYLWSVPAGLSIDNTSAEKPTITVAEVEEDTEYNVTLTVNDGQTVNNTDIVNIKIKVLQVNKLPVANAGSDFTVREQKLAMLDGSASFDPDLLDSLSFNWVAPAGIILSDPTAIKPVFLSPAVITNTNLTFQLTVTDSRKVLKSGLVLPSNVDEVVVTVTPNQAPVADAGDNQQVRINTVVTLHGEKSSDPDGDDLTYLWTGPAEITLLNADRPNPTFTAPDSDVDKKYTFTLVVTDDLGLSDTKTTSVEVISNLPPVIVIAEKEVFVFEGEKVALDATETYDPDGDKLIFDWFHANSDFITKVFLYDTNKPVVTFVAPEVDNLTYIPILLRVNDGVEDVYDLVKVYVKDIVYNAPLANAGADFNINEGQSGNLDGSGSVEIDGRPLKYLWTSAFLVLDDVTSAKPVFTAPEVKADTTVIAVLVVNNGKLSSSPDTVKVTIKNVNKIPVAVAGADIIVNEGDTFTLNGSGSYDPDGDELKYKWNVLGVALPVDNLVSLTVKAPFVEENVTIPVVLVVNDGKINSIPDTLRLTIKQVNQKPEWAYLPKGEASLGYEYTETIKVADPDLKDKISIFAEGLPEWLSLTDNGDGTAKLYSVLVPRKEELLGTHSFTIKATDGTVTIETVIQLIISIKTGTEEFSLKSVKMYPNPTNGVLNIEFNTLPEKHTSVGVYNHLGQMVLVRKADSQNTRLNLLGFPAGLYYIKVSTEKDEYTAKIILY